ncbi:MAG: type II toxin-antitoxin system PemK/MazF family toxin [Vicinamibacteria bacterium]
MAGRLRRGEVRLLKLPAPDKERPVVVLTRDSSLEFLGWTTVAPITSTIRGVRSEAALDVEDGMKGPCVVNAHNIVTVQKHQIGRRVAQLSEAKMRAVCDAIAFSLGCDAR